MTIAKHDKSVHKHTHKHENITNEYYIYHTHIYEYTGLLGWFKMKMKEREKNKDG